MPNEEYKELVKRVREHAIANEHIVDVIYQYSVDELRILTENLIEKEKNTRPFGRSKNHLKYRADYVEIRTNFLMNCLEKGYYYELKQEFRNLTMYGVRLVGFKVPDTKID